MQGSGPIDAVLITDPKGHCSLCGRFARRFVDVTTNKYERFFRACLDCVDDMAAAAEEHDT